MKSTEKIALPSSALPLLLTLLAATPVCADNWQIGASYSHESGDFGTSEDIDISTATVSLAYYAEVWGVSLELPYVTVSGSEDFVPTTSGGGQGSTGSGFGYGNNGSGNNSSSTTPSSTSERVTRAGVGDIGLSISRAFFPETEAGAFHEVILSIKLPTASERDNLGSGEADYSLELVSSIERGNWSPLFAFGYQLSGDPDGIDLNDIWFYTIGVRYALSRATSIGLMYDFSQALVDDEQDSEALSASISMRSADDLALTIELSGGLSDSNADTALLLSISKLY